MQYISQVSLSFYYLIILFVCVWPGYEYGYHVCAWDSLKLELQVVMRHPVGAGNPNWALCKSSQYSNHQATPPEPET